MGLLRQSIHYPQLANITRDVPNYVLSVAPPKAQYLIMIERSQQTTMEFLDLRITSTPFELGSEGSTYMSGFTQATCWRRRHCWRDEFSYKLTCINLPIGIYGSATF